MSLNIPLAAAANLAPKRPRAWPAANALIGGGLLLTLISLALLGLVWSPFDPLKIDLMSRFQAPSATHWLGTDEFGRDAFSRLLIGARTSLWVSLLTVSVAVCAGTLIGMLAGYLRGWTDRMLMMFNDALLAFPGILMALGIMAIIGASQSGLVLALGIAYTPSVVRVVRSSVLSLRELEFIEASRVIGNSELYTMFRHIAPNCRSTVIFSSASLVRRKRRRYPWLCSITACAACAGCSQLKPISFLL